MEMRFLLLIGLFVCASGISQTASAAYSVSGNPDAAGVFNDYDVFSIETLMQTLEKCHIWYDQEQVQKILLYEICKATKKFETLIEMPFELIMQLYSAAQVLTLLPNIHALCIAYLKAGGEYADIFDHRGNPIDFGPLSKQLLNQMNPWLLQNKAASFKAQLTLPFLQRMLKAFNAMSAEQYTECITIVFKPISADYLMSLSQDCINELFEECQKETHWCLQFFEPEVIDMCSDSFEMPDQDYL